MQVGLGPCVRWRTSSPPSKGHSSPIFGPYLLWPNGWMDQDATWWGGRPRPRRHCVRWGPVPPSPKRGETPNFRPISIVSKRLDGSRWHLALRWASIQAKHCARWGPSCPSPKSGHIPQFSAHFYCGQTAGCIKMPLGMEVGLSPGDCVRWGPSFPSPKGVQPPIFVQCPLW